MEKLNKDWMYIDTKRTFKDAEDLMSKNKTCWLDKHPHIEYKIQPSSIGYNLYVNLHENDYKMYDECVGCGAKVCATCDVELHPEKHI